MKRMITLVASILVLSVLTTHVFAAIMGSAHDLSTGGGGIAATDEEQICIFCHTPHQSGNSQDPLWNHTTTTNTNIGYGVYNSTTLDTTPTDIGTGGFNTSLMCMSCHDGSVAVNSILNDSGATPTMGAHVNLTAGDELQNSPNLGQDLSNDHPVNFVYSNSYNLELISKGAAADLETPANVASANLLIGDKVQCASCHDVHNTTGLASLARITLTNSALCTTCHMK
jgi:predicted CXXCH cytochrome family protein